MRTIGCFVGVLLQIHSESNNICIPFRNMPPRISTADTMEAITLVKNDIATMSTTIVEGMEMIQTAVKSMDEKTLHLEESVKLVQHDLGIVKNDIHEMENMPTIIRPLQQSVSATNERLGSNKRIESSLNTRTKTNVHIIPLLVAKLSKHIHGGMLSIDEVWIKFISICSIKYLLVLGILHLLNHQHLYPAH